MNIPDLIEPVIGWRAWSIIPANSREPRLRPYAGELVDWPAGSAAVASCYQNHDVADLAPPVLTCTCGLYAHKTIEQMWSGHPPIAGTTEPMVTWGSVSLWGRVLSYTSGYRAEFGYPQHLWVESPEAAEILRARYLVPVSPLSELMASKPDVGVEITHRMIKPWVDKTGGRAEEFIRLTNPITSSTLEYAWPVPEIARLIAGVPRGHWQRAICVGVFQPGGCEPNRWMDPRGACTKARLASLRDVLSKLAGRGVRIKRVAGRWGGELGANYRVVAIGPDPVAAPRPRTRPYPVDPTTVQP